MGGMSHLLTHQVLRVSSGLSLLVLLAAQEKLFPWLEVAPIDPPSAEQADAQPVNEPGDPADNAPERSQPPTLESWLCDVVAPRRGLVEREPRSETQVLGRRDVGAAPSTARDDDSAPPSAIDLRWLARATAGAPTMLSVTGSQCALFLSPTIGSSIQALAPPHC